MQAVFLNTQFRPQFTSKNKEIWNFYGARPRGLLDKNDLSLTQASENSVLLVKRLMVTLLVFSLSGHASTAEHHHKNDPTKAEDKQELTHTFSFGLEQARYRYVEPDVYQSYINEADRQSGAWWMNLKGNLWGGFASYRLTWQEKLFIQPEFRILYGKHQYNWGQKKKIVSKTNHKIPSLLHESRLIVGGNISFMNKNMTLSPYTGIGYRFKSDDSEEVKTSRTGENLGFYRKSNYVYVPLGASAEYKIDDTWSVSLKGEYDWIVKAWHYTRNKTIPKPVTDKQPNGYGLKGEGSLSYFYNKIKFSVSPYLNYWNIRNSKRSPDGGMEPYNITWESGIKLGVTF
jgi:hypothetical protein